MTNASVSGFAAMATTALNTTALQYNVPSVMWLGMSGIFMVSKLRSVPNKSDGPDRHF